MYSFDTALETIHHSVLHSRETSFVAEGAAIANTLNVADRLRSRICLPHHAHLSSIFSISIRTPSATRVTSGGTRWRALPVTAFRSSGSTHAWPRRGGVSDSPGRVTVQEHWRKAANLTVIRYDENGLVRIDCFQLLLFE